MSELIPDGKTGFLVNNVEEAVEAVNSIEFIDRRDCMEWASSNFSSQKMVDGYLDVYQRILR
jgi:glycosyltransferase involved in cell wall biosynthesis